jgi:hypothetical protein
MGGINTTTTISSSSTMNYDQWHYNLSIKKVDHLEVRVIVNVHKLVESLAEEA